MENSNQQNPQPSPESTKPAQQKNPKKMFLALAAALIIVGVLAYFLANRSEPQKTSTSTSTSTPASKVAENTKVNINSSGFSPDTIEVKTGTQVTWTNTDNAEHQVAADPHPKHDSIPGFNSDILLKNKESYSFTFEKAGTYHYHDHLHPFELRGTVVVK